MNEKPKTVKFDLLINYWDLTHDSKDLFYFVGVGVGWQTCLVLDLLIIIR